MLSSLLAVVGVVNDDDCLLTGRLIGWPLNNFFSLAADVAAAVSSCPLCYFDGGHSCWYWWPQYCHSGSGFLGSFSLSHWHSGSFLLSFSSYSLAASSCVPYSFLAAACRLLLLLTLALVTTLLNTRRLPGFWLSTLLVTLPHYGSPCRVKLYDSLYFYIILIYSLLN